MTGTDRTDREARLCERIACDPLVRKARLIGVYLAGDGEPDLTPLFAQLRSRGARLALPVLEDDPASFAMRFCHWHVDDLIVHGRYGIGIPEEAVTCEPDLLLVPLVGFDRDGNRVGRGAGFFDRYLASSASFKVGTGFACQGFEALPVQPHDVPLDLIITEDETLATSRLQPTTNPSRVGLEES